MMLGDPGLVKAEPFDQPDELGLLRIGDAEIIAGIFIGAK